MVAYLFTRPAKQVPKTVQHFFNPFQDGLLFITHSQNLYIYLIYIDSWFH